MARFLQEALDEHLRAAGGSAVVPVQMMEAWWLLFPDATESVAPRAWRQVLPRRGRDVEMQDDPKQELRRLTAPTGREYTEADAPSIARAVRDTRPSAAGRSASYDRLVALAQRL